MSKNTTPSPNLWKRLLILSDMRFKINFWFTMGIVIFTIALIFEVYLLISPWVNLNDKAAIGDAVNGLTAPIIGIIGAVLIYISFREQVKTNRFQFQSLHEQREWDLLFRLYEELKEDLKSLQPYYGIRYNQMDILDSFMNYVIEDTQETTPYPDISKYLDYLFKQFNFISMRICKNEILDDSEKVYLVEKVRQLFNLYFESYYSRIVEGEFHSKFSTSFKMTFRSGGQAIIDLSNLSIEILKQRFQRENMRG